MGGPLLESKDAIPDGQAEKLLADRPAGRSEDKAAPGLRDGWLGVDAYARTFRDKGAQYE